MNRLSPLPTDAAGPAASGAAGAGNRASVGRLGAARAVRLLQFALLATLGLEAPAGAETPAPASEVGRWQGPERWPVVAIHSAVLPTGEVLQYTYDDFYAPRAATHALIWDPRRGSFRDVSHEKSTFCSGLAFLADGSLYVTGGWQQIACDTQGLDSTFRFDPFSREWVELELMDAPRYYPTNVLLADGRVVIMGGYNEGCSNNPRLEVYDPLRGRLRHLPQGDREIELYPRMHLLPSGDVAHVGPEPRTWLLDTRRFTWTPIAGTMLDEMRYEGVSFVVPGRPWEIMICGGFTELNDKPTATCERIDFSQPQPRWEPAPSMHAARAHANVVLLPDAKVLIVGGGQHDLYNQPVHFAEIYDPETDRWTPAPSQVYGRAYHSTAVLLPDGRVLSAGQDDDHSGHGGSGAWAEIYKPPYLYRGGRPKIRKAPDAALYGESITVRARQARRIESAVLVGLGAVTHSVNMSQRYVALDFEHAGGLDVELEMPKKPELAPPGYYMLFLLNDRGVPSKAHILWLGSETLLERD